jgi:multiple sugar transport system ATP-binding protein
MASVTFDNATRLYPGGTRPAVDKLNLEVGDGEFLVLVGPSGCGKSTSLRMLAGLEEVNSGRILIGDRDVTDIPPKDRDIAMVFQNYALYPHMTVAENMGFALKIAGVGKEERARVLEAAKLLDLEEYLTRKPKALSGGQRQRVAMGRAIVRQPQVFLMDEPLSNLDAKLRVQTRTQIASLQRRLGVTTVYVTHDQTEALTMGDRIAVLKDGLLQQVGTPRDLYEKPNNVFVAGFIGSPAMNLFPVDLASAGGIQFGTAVVDADIDRPTSATQVTAGVRPEDIIVNPADGQGLSVTVDLVEELGADGYLYGHTEIAGKRTDIVARVDGRNHPNAGETVVLAPCRTTCTRSTSSRASASPRRRSPRPDPIQTRRGARSTDRPRAAASPTKAKTRVAHSLTITASSVDAGLLALPGRPLDEWSDTSSRCPRASPPPRALRGPVRPRRRRQGDDRRDGPPRVRHARLLGRLDVPCVERSR